eukprot:m51a1_g5257 hypothetical protein (1336) ;mRNA; f:85508-91428
MPSPLVAAPALWALLAVLVARSHGAVCAFSQGAARWRVPSSTTRVVASLDCAPWQAAFIQSFAFEETTGAGAYVCFDRSGSFQDCYPRWNWVSEPATCVAWWVNETDIRGEGYGRAFPRGRVNVTVRCGGSEACEGRYEFVMWCADTYRWKQGGYDSWCRDNCTRIRGYECLTYYGWRTDDSRCWDWDVRLPNDYKSCESDLCPHKGNCLCTCDNRALGVVEAEHSYNVSSCSRCTAETRPVGMSSSSGFTVVERAELAELGVSVAAYEHGRSGLRVLLAPVPGPLCTAAVVVPTEARDDRGLAHCLEHLVFLGSRAHPQRGLLDLIATRAASSGTNAYTAEDRTTFTASCAGAQGLLDLLPAYLDHLLRPTLTPSAMLTEIYHVTGEGKEQGVVFCEMQGREKTEHDLCERAVHSRMFEGTGYSVDPGGCTTEIAKLRPEDVSAFHRRFYRPDRMGLVIIGPVDPEKVFAALEASDLPSSNATRREACEESPAWSDAIPALEQSRSAVVTFPAPEDDEEGAQVGSVVVAYRGPEWHDVETAAALEVLFRHLQESAASPLRQRFVERDEPLASDVDVDVLPYRTGSIEFTFSGVPRRSASRSPPPSKSSRGSKKRGGRGKKSGQRCKTPKPSTAAGEEESDERCNPLAPGVLRRRLEALLRSVRDDVACGRVDMAAVARRHYVKHTEDLEDEPHDVLLPLLELECTFRSAPAPAGGRLARRLAIREALAQLEARGPDFWAALVDRWLLSGPHVEVVMVPDARLSRSLAADADRRLRDRRAALGDRGLRACADELDAAMREQERSALGDAVPSGLPAVPPASSVRGLPVRVRLCAAGSGPFAHAHQVVEAATPFVHVRMGLDTSAMPEALRSYLVLFQELLLTCPVLRAGAAEPVGYREVVRQLHSEFVSLQCGVGMGNATFTCECLPDCFYVLAVCEPRRYAAACAWLADVLAGVRFTRERVESVAANLLAFASEDARDGGSVCEAAAIATTTSSRMELLMSAFVQPRLLERLRCELRKSPAAVLARLEDIRCFLATRAPVLVQFCAAPTSGDPVGPFAAAWQRVGDARTEEFALGGRVPAGGPQRAAPSLPRGALVGVSGVETAFVGQCVACDVPKQHEDFFPLVVLCEMLERTEGPLYRRVRGAGLAYDVSLAFHHYARVLCFTLYESSTPDKALGAFYDILRELPQTWDSLCCPFNIETARSTLLYHFHSSRSTVPLVCAAAFKGLVTGFPTPVEEEQYQQRLDSVDQAALKRVYERYLAHFLDPERRMTCVVAGPSEVPHIARSFASGLGVKLESTSVRGMSHAVEEAAGLVARAKTPPPAGKKAHTKGAN